MTGAEASRPRHAGRHRAGAPTRLGLTLRSVALHPRDGHASAKRTAERRARAGERLPEGATPYVLAAAGGAGLMCLWLKLGALAGLRRVSSADFGVEIAIAAVVLGAVLGVGGQVLWGAVGPRTVQRLGGDARPAHLRLAWGSSAVPLVGVLGLLPLDLAIVGPAALASDPLRDPVATAWAALSIAVGVALALWSAWLFLRGIEIASALGLRRALAAAVVGGACLAVPAAAVAAAGTAAAGAGAA